MPASLNQSKTGSGTAPSVAVTWNSNTTTGNLIVLCISAGSASTVVSITDSQSNTYTKVDSLIGSVSDAEFWYAKNITGGTTPTVTITLLSILNVTVVMEEWNGPTSDPLDVHTIAEGSSTALDSGLTSISTQGKNLILGWGMSENTSAVTVGNTYSNLVQSNVNQTTAIESKISSGVEAHFATFTATLNAWVCGVAVFKLNPDSGIITSKLRPRPFAPGIAR